MKNLTIQKYLSKCVFHTYFEILVYLCVQVFCLHK